MKDNGYKIIARNYKSALGEVDVIAQDRDTLCFVEVKSRSSARCGAPEEAVSRMKQRKISRTALGFLKEGRLLDRKARFDVVAVVCASDPPQIRLIRDAFELAQDFIY